MEYGVVSQQLKHLSGTEYETLRELCHAAKNLTNEAVYLGRQYFLRTGTILDYDASYRLLRDDSVNYRVLNSNMAQQTLKDVAESFRSFAALRHAVKTGTIPPMKVRLPGYLPKDGFAPLVVGFVRLKDDRLVLPYSNLFSKIHENITIKLPPVLKGRKVKEIRILPRMDARFFEVQYVYETEASQRELNINNALALDIGIDNLLTGVTSLGDSFIIDGRELKSFNEWYNKENARLAQIYAAGGFDRHKITDRQARLLTKRNNQIRDYVNKAARWVINYCAANDLGTVVLGYNKGFQNAPNMGRANNQKFTFIPFGRLKKRIEELCEQSGIRFVEQEESYTSKASFWDRDPIPVYGHGSSHSHTFSGKRVKRGLYRTKNGMLLNADVNGALNILRKSNVVDLTILYGKGYVTTPARVRLVSHATRSGRQPVSRKSRSLGSAAEAPASIGGA